jgi:hypothetical protein
MFVMMGCGCGLPGATVTLYGKVLRNTNFTGNLSLDPVPVWEYWSLTGTTDASGRYFFCPTEEVPMLLGVYYDSDANRYDNYTYLYTISDPPDPYIGPIDSRTLGTAFTWYHVAVTPDDHFCQGQVCTAEPPSSLTVTLGTSTRFGEAAGTTFSVDLHGATRHGFLAEFWYSACVTYRTAPLTQLVVMVSVSRTASGCDPGSGFVSTYRKVDCESGPADLATHMGSPVGTVDGCGIMFTAVGDNPDETADVTG